MQPPNMKKSFQGSITYYFLVPLIIGLHVGWFTLQQRYVAESERHDHPLTKLYKKYISQ